MIDLFFIRLGQFEQHRVELAGFLTHSKGAGEAPGLAAGRRVQRRIDLALRYLSVGAVRSAHKNAKSFEECIVDELLLAYKSDPGSFAIARKEERERVARSAR